MDRARDERSASRAWPAIDEGLDQLASDPKAAGACARRALALAQDDPHGEARAAARFLLGRSHLRRGESQEALRALLDALRYYEGVDETTATRVECCIGVAHGMWGSLGEATRFLERALERAELLDEDTLARARNSLAMTLIARGEHELARAHTDEVIRYAREHDRPPLLSIALNNLAVINREAGRVEEAISCWQETLRLKRDLNEERGVATVLMNLAHVHLDRGDLEEVERTLRPGLALIERHSLQDYRRDGLALLARYEESRGDLNAAIDALRQLTEHQAREFDEARTRSIAEMQARFDKEAAEREVERTRRRARELSDALRQADRMGAIGRLAGGIAHDFNNVLTAMMGYADLILMTIDKESPVCAQVREIRRGGERATQLTHQLLAFSRKQVLKPEVLDLSDSVRELLRMLRRLLGEDIELETNLRTDLHPVFVDAGQVEQVIVNLAVNARDAMPEGGVLRIETKNVDPAEVPVDVRGEVDADAFVRLDVTDRGTGIPAHVIEHIFEPFFTTKDEAEGTGLGLATVYGIVQQSGGAIRVESEEGTGTSFSIYFPRTTQQVPQLAPPTLAGDLPGGTETVLVVEDNGAIRELTRQVLRACGYRVFAVGDPESGLDLVDQHLTSVDLLLTDVVLPGMRGTELASRMAAQCPEMRVLFMSGYPFEALNDKGILDPGIELMRKPFTPAALAESVRRVLDAIETPAAEGDGL